MRKGIVLLFLYLLLAAGILFALETAARSFEPHEDPPLHQMRRSLPYLYSLNPDHPEINQDGLRDPREAGPKSPGETRILLLGDSLTYGLFVPQPRTFAARLEHLFAQKGESVRVLNAGVSGYTPYNELKWLETEGARFEPDVIVAVLCMNDLVNPVAHWGDPDGAFSETPAEAFPDYLEHQQKIAPELYRPRNFAVKLLSRSALYRFIEKQRMLWRLRPVRYEQSGGREWPVYVADESAQSIRVWSNPDSPEMLWLEGMLESMHREARLMGARFKVVLIPLAYQLEKDYPFNPGPGFAELCRRAQLDCLDMLPVLQQSGSENLFLGKHAHHLQDVWHLSSAGHAVTAEALYAFLEREDAASVKTELDVSL